jgi:hypothetical protein
MAEETKKASKDPRIFALIATSFSSAFAKLRKGTPTSYLSVFPSVCLVKLGSHWTDFDKICYFKNFKKFCRENSSLTKI